MKNLRKTGLAALLLAVSLGGYAVCVENVQAAGEDVELEMEEFSDEQELTTEDQDTSEEEIAADLSGDQEEQDGVHLDGDVVLGDDRLRGEVCDLFLQGDFASDSFDEGDLQVDTHPPDCLESAQPFHDVGTGLLYDDDVLGQDQQHQDDQNDRDDKLIHKCSFLMTPKRSPLLGR